MEIYVALSQVEFHSIVNTLPVESDSYYMTAVISRKLMESAP